MESEDRKQVQEQPAEQPVQQPGSEAVEQPVQQQASPHPVQQKSAPEETVQEGSASANIVQEEAVSTDTVQEGDASAESQEGTVSAKVQEGAVSAGAQEKPLEEQGAASMLVQQEYVVVLLDSPESPEHTRRRCNYCLNPRSISEEERNIEKLTPARHEDWASAVMIASYDLNTEMFRISQTCRRGLHDPIKNVKRVLNNTRLYTGAIVEAVKNNPENAFVGDKIIDMLRVTYAVNGQIFRAMAYIIKLQKRLVKLANMMVMLHGSFIERKENLQEMNRLQKHKHEDVVKTLQGMTLNVLDIHKANERIQLYIDDLGKRIFPILHEFLQEKYFSPSKFNN